MVGWHVLPFFRPTAHEAVSFICPPDILFPAIGPQIFFIDPLAEFAGSAGIYGLTLNGGFLAKFFPGCLTEIVASPGYIDWAKDLREQL
jgi:hypothetical protein